MIDRFRGDSDGKRRLLEAIQGQKIVGGDPQIASALTLVGTLVQFEPSNAIIEQDAEDNDIYFIIAGSASVKVKKREIALRSSGSHVGEMALIDSSSKRSASVIAMERTVTLKVKEGDFSQIATAHPILWRRIGVELAARLRERSKFVDEPNAIPHVFIGCSSEYLDQSKILGEEIKSEGAEVKLWTDGVFQASKSALESLTSTAKLFDFAVLILSPDDLIESRGEKVFAPRDNVIFELGLFMGTIGPERCFIVSPKNSGIKIPSDLLGITRIEFDSTNVSKSTIELGCQIRDAVKRQKPK